MGAEWRGWFLLKETAGDGVLPQKQTLSFVPASVKAVKENKFTFFKKKDQSTTVKNKTAEW